MNRKIAFEEHFNLPQFEVPRYYGDVQALQGVKRRLLDVSEQRLADMDAIGIEYAILSLNSPGLQAETDARQAVNAVCGHVGAARLNVSPMASRRDRVMVTRKAHIIR